MATTAYSGAVSISTDNVTYNALSSVRSIDLDDSVDELETDYIGGGGNKASAGGLRGREYSLECDFSSETAQAAIRTAASGRSAIYIKYLPDGTNGWYQQVKCFNFKIGSSADGLVTFSCTLKSQAAEVAVP